MLAFFILTHMNMKMNVKPIGIIRNSVNETLYFDAQNVTSEIVVNPEYVRGLASIETFSHIIVLFWLDRIKSAGRKVLKVHPCRDFTLPLVGVFSSRSPRRPNPIAVTTVKLVERQSNVLIDWIRRHQWHTGAGYQAISSRKNKSDRASVPRLGEQTAAAQYLTAALMNN